MARATASFETVIPSRFASSSTSRSVTSDSSTWLLRPSCCIMFSSSRPW